MTTETSPTLTDKLKGRFYRPPFVGMLAFVIVFLMQGLGHTQMVLMEAIFGEHFVFQSAAILGDRHPVTYGIFFGATVWSIYLIRRLAQMWKVTTAIRYAIPTAIIAYSAYEIAGRWNLYTDVWVHPGRYWLELSLLFAALIVVVAIAAFTPQHQKARLDREGQLKHS